MSTPADELRAAAEKLRELAAKATTDICPDWIYSAVRHVARNCEIECSHDDHQAWDQPQWDWYEDWSYIAAMHPGVGYALADWLDTEAQRLATTAHPDWQEVCSPNAVTVARQILGTAK